MNRIGFSRRLGTLTRPSILSRYRRLRPEPLEDRRMLAIDIALAGGVLSITDNSAEANDLRLIVNGADLEITDTAGIAVDGNESFFNGTDLARYALAGITSIEIDTASDNDLITIDLSGGFMPGGSLALDAGTGNDRLTITGTPTTAINEVLYAPGPANDEGRLTYYDGSANELLEIEFSGLEPIVDQVPAFALSVYGTAGDNTMSYTNGVLNPGTHGLVSVDAFETIEFSNKQLLNLLGLGGEDTITLDNANQPTGLLDVWVEGGDDDDTITLTSLPTTLGVTVTGGAGNDLIDGSAITQAALTLVGDEGDDTLLGGTGDDWLDGGDGNDSLVGGDGNDTLIGGDGDDWLHGGAGNDTFLPGPGNNTVFGGGGDDTLTSEGTVLDDTFALTWTGGNFFLTINATVNELIDIQNLVLNGFQGDDTFIVDLGGASGLSFSLLEINGGDGFDQLVIQSGGAGINTVTHTFANAHDGTVDVDGNQIAYTGLDPIADNLNPANRVFTFDATDDIVFLGDDGTPGNGLSRISSATSSEEVIFAGPTNSMTVNLGDGADQITVAPLDVLTPLPGGLTINGDDGDDDLLLHVTPLGTAVTFDGGGGTNTVRVVDTAGVVVTRVEAEFGPAAGEGQLRHVGAANATLMTLAYSGVAVAIDGVTSQRLSFSGTAAADTINYTNGAAIPNTHGRLATALGALEFSNKTQLAIDALAGADTITLSNPQRPTGLVEILVDAGAGDDVINAHTLPATTPLTVLGGADNDVLNVDFFFNPPPGSRIRFEGGAGNNRLVLLSGGTATRVEHVFVDANSGHVDVDGVIIEYTGLEPINDNLAAVDRVFTFGGTNDVITLEDDGVAANGISRISSVASSETVDFVDPTGSITINAGAGNDTITVRRLDTLANTPGQIRINGQGGDDRLNVEVTDAGTLITFDGGAGSDLLVVNDTAGNVVGSVQYAPGPATTAGRLTYRTAGGALLMTVDIVELEPIIDNVVAATLTVDGTPAANTITYVNGVLNPGTHGRVTVDNFELIEFSNKVNLTLRGLAGDDSIVLDNAAAPTGLATIRVEGNEGRDAISVRNIPAAIPLTIDGGTGNDVLTVITNGNVLPGGTITYAAGSGSDELILLQDPGAVAVANIIHTFTSATAGNVSIDAQLVNYTGLEKVSDRIEGVNNRTFNFPNVANTVNVGDNGAPGDGLNRLSSVATSPTVDFFAPLVNWNINLGGAADRLVIGQLDALSGFQNMAIDAGGGDDVVELLPTVGPGVAGTLFTVNGGLGNDTLIVQARTSAAAALASVAFDGGGGINTLETINAPGTTLSTARADLGAAANAGTLTYQAIGGAGQLIVNYTSAGTVIDSTTAARQIVATTGLADTVTYANGLVRPDTHGRVTTGVAGAMEFSNKTRLEFALGAGSDTLLLNNPQRPTGLTQVVVDGGADNDTITLAQLPATAPTTVLGGAGNDTLIIDFAGGSPPPGPAVLYDGGTGNDRMVLQGGGPFTRVEHVFFNANSGRVDVDGVLVTYQNLEPINDNLAAVDRVFTFGGTNDVITLGDDGVANNGISRISSVASSETVDFVDPTGSITINAGAGHDTITVQRLDALANSPGQIRINGQDGDDQLILHVTDAATHITFDGGGGSDLLVVNDTAGINVNSVVYAPGPATTAGRLTYRALGGVALMTVDIVELEPIIDNVVAATLTVDGTPAANTITYTDGVLNPATHGRVTVDNFELIEFTNKATLLLRGLAGADTIVLDNANQPTGLTGIIVEGNEGNDTITLANLPAATPATVLGGAGDDYIDGSLVLAATLNLQGGAGNDTLIGGGANDTLIGEAGDDVLVASPGDNTYNGGSGFDTLLINGTQGADVIDYNQTAANALVLTVNGNVRNETFTGLELARIEALAGADLMRVRVSDALFNVAGASLPVHVHGGLDFTSDRLVIVDDGTPDLILHRRAESSSAGRVTVGPGNVEPFETTFEGVEIVQFVDTAGVGISGPASDGRLVVFKHDPFEGNDDRFNATHLGAAEAINVDPTIDPGGLQNPFGDGTDLPGDEDWYRVEALYTGTLDFQVFFRQIDAVGARPGLPGGGNLSILVYDFDGTLIAGNGNFGTNDNDDDERVRIPAVAGQIYFLRVFGATAPAVNNYSISVLNVPAPVPFDIELLDFPPGDPPPANSDTGRSQFDDVTRDNTPTILLRLDDSLLLHDLPGNPVPDNPPDEVIPIPFQILAQPGYRVAIFVEGDPINPVGFATQDAEGIYRFTFPVPLADGSHFITAKVQMIDPALPAHATGFGARSQSLEIIVDTVVPPVSFGDPLVVNDGLHAASDSGVPGPDTNGTFVDRVTSDTTPTFFGTAEANSIVRLYLRDNLGGRLLIGQTVATPLDGTNQFPGGRWEITSAIDFNDPVLGFPEIDGLRIVEVEAEDLAGNVNTVMDGIGDAQQTLQIFIDTQGPIIYHVFITDAPAYNLFELKPSQGPTPLVWSLSLRVADFPARSNADPNFLYPALVERIAENLGHYLVVGDHVGVVDILDVEFISDPIVDGLPARGTIVVTFAEPLPDDRYTMTVSDSLVDPANNKLDGETDAIQPEENPQFTGDGVPGGNAVGRFTIDSRPEIGVYAHETVHIDINGNFVWDQEGKDNDQTNRDLAFKFGFSTDVRFAGNFAPPGALVADGFDKLAAYGFVNGQWRWIYDFNHDGVVDLTLVNPLPIQGYPVAGNFNPLIPGDQIGLFTGTHWYLDTNGNFVIDAGDTVLAGDMRGFPIVGDFDGDGLDDLGTWFDNHFYFDLAFDGLNGSTDPGQIIPFGFPGVRERPVAADMDGDGIDDIGLWVPDNSTQGPAELSEWYFLISNDFDGTRRIPGQVNTLHHAFSPRPLGYDLFARFGDSFGIPIVGNFDPPVKPVTTPPTMPTTNTTTTATQPSLEMINRWSAAANWIDIQVGDFNGDGREDVAGRVAATGEWWVALTNADGSVTNKLWGRWSPTAHWVDVQAADVNGDGRLDLVGRVAATGEWWVALSGPNGSTNKFWGRWSPSAQWVDVQAADVNGDGRADLVGRVANTGEWWAAVSTANGSTNRLWGRWSPAINWADVRVGDFDGDGRDDIAGRSPASGEWWVAFSGANSSTNALFARWSPSTTWVDVRVGDLTGDGRADLIARSAGNGQWVAAVSLGRTSQNRQWGKWSTGAVWTDVLLGDFNGDGQAELIGRQASRGEWWLSPGPPPAAAAPGPLAPGPIAPGAIAGGAVQAAAASLPSGAAGPSPAQVAALVESGEVDLGDWSEDFVAVWNRILAEGDLASDVVDNLFAELGK